MWEAERTLALVYHEEYLRHEQHPTHPERRERLSYTVDRFEEEGLFEVEGIDLVEPEPVDRDVIELVHDPEHVELIRQMSESGGGVIDLDTAVTPETYKQALLAAGGSVLAVELVVRGEYDTAFAMVRPPGHHAGRAKAAGFCYFNNAAIATEYAIRELDVDSVAILDWDAHHGDGTQEIFYERDDVLYVSIHQDGRTLYPGTGFPYEAGEGPGEGYTVNVPVPPRSGDRTYREAFRRIVEPVVKEFNPDLVLISAGQDCHFTDPITDLAVTAEGYRWMMERATELAEDVGALGPIAVLEGGYSVEEGLPYTNLGVACGMAGIPVDLREPVDPPEENPRGPERVREVAREHSRYWDSIEA
ncbi:histone deacetylase family protein [Methanopyrus sp.]